MRSFPLQAAAGQRALLVAPHADDEVLGCGGTAHRLAALGAHVHVVVLARGDGGIDGRTEAGQRRDECRRACAILGLQPPAFLGLASADLRADPVAAARALRDAAGGAVHDLLLVPSPLERHPTHRAALLAALLAGVARPGAAWWGWGVWDALPACADVAEVDVTDARRAKTEALAAHRSQVEGRPLAPAVAGRDLAQAAFSRLTGDEPRRAVERLLCLEGLAPLPGGCDDPAAARAHVAAWLRVRSAAWVDERWGPDADGAGGPPGRSGRPEP